MASKKSGQNKLFFLALFAGAAYLAYQVFAPYITLVVMAFLITALYSPIRRKIYKKVKNDDFANALAILSIFISILVPLTFVSLLTYNQILEFNADIRTFLEANDIELEDLDASAGDLPEIEDSNPNAIGTIDLDRVIEESNEVLASIPFGEGAEIEREDVNNFIGDVVGPVSNFFAQTALNIGGSTLNMITSFFIFIVLLGTFFSQHDKIVSYYKKLSPLDDRIDEMYIDRLTVMGTSMIKGVFVIATAQGIASGIILYLMGVDYVIFWTLLSIIVSIVPLGAGIINIPIGVIHMLSGNVWQGAAIILGNIFLVGNIDNILRPKLVPKEAELPSAVVLIGALGGVSAFGPLGFIYGPIVMVILKTTLEVYVKYYKSW